MQIIPLSVTVLQGRLSGFFLSSELPFWSYCKVVLLRVGEITRVTNEARFFLSQFPLEACKTFTLP